MRRFTDSFDWFEMAPHPELLSHDDGVYLMAQPGRQYAVGFDGGGTVELDATPLRGPAQLRWINAHEGEWIELRTLTPDPWLAVVTSAGE
jgi:hypothetical protein